jgi:hypothetical protein
VMLPICADLKMAMKLGSRRCAYKKLKADVRDNFEKHTADLASLREMQRALKSSESSPNRLHNTAASIVGLHEAEIGHVANSVFRAARVRPDFRSGPSATALLLNP